MISSSPVAGGEGERSVMVLRRYDPPARRDRDQRSKAASTAWISGASPAGGARIMGRATAPRLRARRPPMAHPRAHPRLPPGGRVGAADAGRPRRLPPAGAAVHVRPPGAERLARRAGAVGDPVEGRELLGWDGPDGGGRPGRRRSAAGCPPTCATAPAARTSTRRRSRPCTCSRTSGPRRSSTGPSTGSCTSAGSRTGPAATAARWPCWSSRTGGSAPPTWPRSGRSGT